MKRTFNAPHLAQSLKELEYHVSIGGRDLLLYAAGKRFDHQFDYNRVFPRDGFTSVFAADHPLFLKNLLIFSAFTQGGQIDPFTGEEPGKIVHEWPGIDLRGHNTTYASADTTPLFLIGWARHWSDSQDEEFIRQYIPSINLALTYVESHTLEHLFWDSPSYANADRYALWSSCWRDGGFPERPYRDHAWPASFLMINILVIHAYRALAEMCENSSIKLKHTPDEMRQQAENIKHVLFQLFWVPKSNILSPVIDDLGRIETLYLDTIWSLSFLEPNDVPDHILATIPSQLQKLCSPIGYYNREKTPGVNYDNETIEEPQQIWPLEQAYLALFAEKFNLPEVLDTLRSLQQFLNDHQRPYNEFIQFNDGTPEIKGCDIQLWTIAFQEVIS